MKIFYGWIIVAAAFVTMAIGVNARTAFSLLFPPILDEFGWDRASVAGIFSFGFFMSALLAPFVGRMVDVRTQENLTEKRINELTRVDFDKLPLERAIVTVKGSGARKVAVFSDPDCPYCKQHEKEQIGRAYV